MILVMGLPFFFALGAEGVCECLQTQFRQGHQFSVRFLRNLGIWLL